MLEFLRDHFRRRRAPAAPIALVCAPTIQAVVVDLLPDRVRQEARAAEVGYILPWYRTAADLEAAIARCAAALAEEVEDELAPPLAPDAAAAAFVAWVRASGRTGTYAADELQALYETHCREAKRFPCASNQLRKYLPRQLGVFRTKAEAKIGDRRSRPTVWQIEDVMQMRRAA